MYKIKIELILRSEDVIMKLFEQLVTFNNVTHIGNVFDIVYKENEETGKFNVCDPIKVLILSDSMERATCAVEYMASAIIKPNQFAIRTERDKENIYDLGLLVGLPFRVYNKLHQTVDINTLGDFDYIVHINYDKECRFIPNYECSVNVLKKVVSCVKGHDDYNKGISDYIGGINRDKLFHQNKNHLLAISSDIMESIALYKSICIKMGYGHLFEGYTGSINLTTRDEETGEVVGKTKGIQGIPMMLIWKHKKHVDLSACIPYTKYIVLE